MNDLQRLDIPGVKGTVELKGAQGIFYSVVHDGVPVKPTKGRWLLPAKHGESVELRARGFLPGFQRLYADGTEVADMGASVPTWLKALPFVSFLLVVVNPFVGAIVAVLLFFLGIGIVKNLQMPAVLRAVMTVANTLAATVIIALLVGAVSQGAGQG